MNPVIEKIESMMQKISISERTLWEAKDIDDLLDDLIDLRSMALSEKS